MKLFLKILLFIFTMIVAVGKIQSSTMVNIVNKEILSSIFQETQSFTVISGNHSENICLNGENVVAYSERVVSANINVAKGGTTVYRAVGAAEKASINSSKSFLLKEGGAEVKWFAKSLEDAQWYGNKLFPEGYSVIRGTVNPAINIGTYWYPTVDIGSYVFPGNVLPYITPIIP